MKVLHQGQAPQTLLQLRPLAGSIQRIGVRAESHVSVRHSGRTRELPSPPGIQMALSVEVTRISRDDGDVHYRFVLEQMDLRVKAGTPVKDAEALRAELAPLPGLRGEGRVSPHGRSNHFQVALPKDLSSHLDGPLQQLLKTLGGMGTFLPSSAVGLGARWEHQTQGPLSTTTVEFKTLEKKEVGLRMELFSPPSSTEPRTQSRGQGGCVMSLDRLWPIRYELEVDTHAHVQSQDDGPPRRLETTTHLRMRIRELSFTSPLPRPSTYIR
ncbi:MULTISPECIES: hypothetical protein [Myxococcus]|uniref:hypothetical protein n=1 Tax=Myxococcus TaxID=32 RepID=UPI0011426433|nr:MULTISPECIES: hypothetical protein [Myxococcus]NOK00692.1 hypothetical protein [Myxococcus xanthus]